MRNTLCDLTWFAVELAVRRVSKFCRASSGSSFAGGLGDLLHYHTGTLDKMPRDLGTASLHIQQAANNAQKDGRSMQP